VHTGAGPWLHVPAGKLREDRYLPLHPNLVALIDEYRSRHAAAGNPLLRDDAVTKHQDHRGQLFASLLARIDQDAS
jgi:hypothetical protein